MPSRDGTIYPSSEATLDFSWGGEAPRLRVSRIDLSSPTAHLESKERSIFHGHVSTERTSEDQWRKLMVGLHIQITCSYTSSCMIDELFSHASMLCNWPKLAVATMSRSLVRWERSTGMPVTVVQRNRLPATVRAWKCNSVFRQGKQKESVRVARP